MQTMTGRQTSSAKPLSEPTTETVQCQRMAAGAPAVAAAAYVLDEQVGYLMRRAQQRHSRCSSG